MNKTNSIDHCLRATWQAVAKMYNEEATKQDYTMAMAFAVLNIDYENGTPSTALGPLMGMEATSLSRILKSMEDKGIIFREKNPDDGRGVLLKLTAIGKEKREQAKQSVLRFNEVVRQNVNEEEIKAFFKITNTITQLIANNKIFGTKRKAS